MGGEADREVVGMKGGMVAGIMARRVDQAVAEVIALEKRVQATKFHRDQRSVFTGLRRRNFEASPRFSDSTISATGC